MSNWVQYKVKKDDDINSLSKKYDINWKILAKTNKLKAPYIIRSGDILKVPPKKLGDKKTIGKQIKSDIENNKTRKTVKPKNKTVEKNKAMPKTKTETKPKRATKSKPIVKKEHPTKPQVDEINSIV